MATVTITLTDVDVSKKTVNMQLHTEQLPADNQPTAAMLTAMHFKHLFVDNKVNLDATIRRIKGEIMLSEAVRKAADES